MAGPHGGTGAGCLAHDGGPVVATVRTPRSAPSGLVALGWRTAGDAVVSAVHRAARELGLSVPPGDDRSGPRARVGASAAIRPLGESATADRRDGAVLSSGGLVGLAEDSAGTGSLLRCLGRRGDGSGGRLCENVGSRGSMSVGVVQPGPGSWHGRGTNGALQSRATRARRTGRAGIGMVAAGTGWRWSGRQLLGRRGLEHVERSGRRRSRAGLGRPRSGGRRQEGRRPSTSAATGRTRRGPSATAW